ncbi:MAG: PIN domain-containing protein [Longimicrobiaceae bacterium]
MNRFVLDAQMMIRAFRQQREAERYWDFLSASTVYLCSVVAQELLSGARDDEMRRLRREFLEPFENLKRLATPTHRGWSDAGLILRQLRRGGFAITPAFTNDVLIAVSAAEIGATLVHDNSRDFTAIKRYFPRLKDTVGWPAKAA